MKKWLLSALLLLTTPALAQWQVPDHAVPIGRGVGTGFKNAGPCGPGQTLAWTSASVDPTCTNGANLSATCLNITSPAFGGSGNNVIDNVTPLINAYAALSGTGGCIYFPPGKYKFTTSVSYSIPAGIFSVTLVGSGPDSTVLTWPNAAGGLTYNYAGVNSSTHFRDLSLTTGTTNGGNALTLNMASSVVNVGVAATSDIYRVTMRGDDGYRATDYWTTGLNIANVSGVQVDNLTVAGSSTQQGIGTNIVGLPGSSTYAVLLDIAKSNYVGLASGLIYGSFVQGVTVDQTNFTFVTNGIGSAGSETGALVQLAVTNSQFNPGTVSGGSGINTQTEIGGVQLTNNFFVIGGPSQFGILIGRASHCQIAYNQLQGINSTAGIAITIGTQISGAPCIVSHNDIYGWGTGGLGIWLQTTSANVLVDDNVFAVNTTNILNQGTGNTISASYPSINVLSFGAKGDGSADDTSAIQAAINALPTSGGEIIFPVGNYKITSTLSIGNGTGAAASTRQGVILRGVGIPVQQGFPGFTATVGPKITWAGGTGSSIINVAGPLQGWGVQNLYLNCASIGTMQGITVTSAQYGDNRNLAIFNCFRGIASSTVVPFGSFTNTDSFNNKWYQTTVVVPATAGAMGILLTGAAATANTDYNTFTNTDIFLPASSSPNGIYIQVADTNHFYNTHIYGGSATAVCVTFDYSIANQFPSANRFTGIDLGTCGGGATWNPSGTPGAGAKPNYAYIDEANGATVPNIVNLMAVSSNGYVTSPGGNNAGTNILGAWTAFTPTVACGTATFTTNSARRLTMGKTTNLQLDFTFTALGTCTNALTFNLPATGQSTAVISGINVGTTQPVMCRVAGGGGASTCFNVGGGNYVNGQNVIVSGIYENQ